MMVESTVKKPASMKNRVRLLLYYLEVCQKVLKFALNYGLMKTVYLILPLIWKTGLI